MVAIYAPQPELDEWSPAPLGKATRGGRVRRPARPLPDRATRVRRRRLAALVAAALLCALGAGLVQLVAPAVAGDGGSDGSGTGDGGGRPVAGEPYVVQPGDTLWSIAARVAPGDDPRRVVDRLQAAHGDSALQVGDRLLIDVD